MSTRTNEGHMSKKDYEVLENRCQRLEDELNQLKRAIMAIIDTGEKLQAFKLCFQIENRPFNTVPEVTKITTTKSI